MAPPRYAALGLAALLVAVAALAGCAEPATVPPPPAQVAPQDARVVAALGVAPALGLPTFGAPVTVATGFLGEPTLLADHAGTLYLTFPGCDNNDSCAHGPVYRSRDGGAAWAKLNPLSDGRLSEDGPEQSNGDAMLAIDADGTLYASDLGAGIPVWASDDGGDSWHFGADVVPKGGGADRQWSWGGPSGMAVEAWMATSPTRSVAVAVSQDHGHTFSPAKLYEDGIGWIGPVTGSDDGVHLAVAYTLPAQPAPDVTGLGSLLLVQPVHLKLLLSNDSGASWTPTDTGVTIQPNPAGAQWPGTLMAPIVARLGSGALVYAWSQEPVDASRAGGPAAVVKAMVSRDEGATWSEPVTLSGDRTAVMPWVVAGAGDRFEVHYYAASDVRVDNDYEGTWDLDATIADATDAATMPHQSMTVESGVHQGGICARGGVCGETASDRSLLDFIGGALLPDGRIALTYCASPSNPASGLLGSSATQVHVTVQSGGSRLSEFLAPVTSVASTNTTAP